MSNFKEALNKLRESAESDDMGRTLVNYSEISKLLLRDSSTEHDVFETLRLLVLGELAYGLSMYDDARPELDGIDAPSTAALTATYMNVQQILRNIEISKKVDES